MIGTPAHSELVAALLGRDIQKAIPTVKNFSVPQGTPFELVPEGTVGVIVAKDAGQLADIENAIDASDFQSVLQQTAKSQAQFQRLLLGKRRVVASFDVVPVFGELRYAGMPLIQGIFLPGRVPLAVSKVLYSGAQFDPGLFEFVQKARPDAGAGDALSALVLVREPDLTALERRVLARVPSDSPDRVFHPGGPVFFTPAAVAAAIWVGEAAAAGAVGWAVGKGLDAAWDWAFGVVQSDIVARQRFDTALADSDIANMSADLAVGELIRLRSRAIQAPSEQDFGQ